MHTERYFRSEDKKQVDTVNQFSTERLPLRRSKICWYESTWQFRWYVCPIA